MPGGEGAALLLGALGPAATIASAFIGFLGGTVINHMLAVRRANRERHDRQIDICQGLIAELATNSLFVHDYQQEMNDYRGPTDVDPSASIETPETRFYDDVRGELGFLGWELLSAIHSEYANLLALSAFAKHNRKGSILSTRIGSAILETRGWLYDQRIIERDLFKFQEPILRSADRKAWAKKKPIQQVIEKHAKSPPPSA